MTTTPKFLHVWESGPRSVVVLDRGGEGSEWPEDACERYLVRWFDQYGDAHDSLEFETEVTAFHFAMGFAQGIEQALEPGFR